MPITYEPSDRLIRYYRWKTTRALKKAKLAPTPEVGTFLAGVFTGFFVLPFVMSFIGYKLEKMRV